MREGTENQRAGFQHRLRAGACVDNVSLSDYRYYFASFPFRLCVTRFEAWTFIVSARYQLKVSGTWQCGNRDTRETVSSANQFPIFKIYYLSQIRYLEYIDVGRNERNLIGFSGDLTLSCRVMSIKLLLHSQRRRYIYAVSR